MEFGLGDWFYTTFQGEKVGGFITSIKVENARPSEKYPKTLKYENHMDVKIDICVAKHPNKDNIGKILKVIVSGNMKNDFISNTMSPLTEEELKLMIDDALDKNDRNWFMELTEKLKELGGVKENGKAAHTG